MARDLTWKVVPLAFCCLLGGCNGLIDDPAEQPWNSDRPRPQAPPLEEFPTTDPVGRDFRFQCSDLATRGWSNIVRRLSKGELERTLNDTFGPGVFAAASVPLQRFVPDRLDDNVYDFRPKHDDNTIGTLVDVALDAAVAAAASAATFAPLSSACRAPQFSSRYAPACVDELVRFYGRLLYRRPLGDDEVGRYLEIYDEAAADTELAASFRAQTELVLAALIEAPEVLFHIPRGSATADGRFQVDAYTVAARLSYGLTGGPPDAELRAAADADALLTVAQLEPHAQRLLAGNAGKAVIEELASYWWAGNIAPLPGLAVSGHAGVEATSLRDQAAIETRRFARYVFFDAPMTFAEMMRSQVIFPAGDALASALGVAQSEQAVSDSTRRGVLTRPAFLMSKGDRPKPIIRGVHIRTHLLCDDIPDPPANADEVAETATASLDRTQFTARQLADAATKPAQCTACHALLNPLGAALSHFGALGDYGSEELVFGADGSVVNTLPVDSSVSETMVESSGESGDGADELAELIATSIKGSACAAQQMFRFSRLRSESEEDDACLMHELEIASANGATLQELWIQANIAEDIFWARPP